MKMFACFALLMLTALPANAADVDSVAKDIIGAWRLDFTPPDDVKRTPMVIVGRQHDELVAWYVENGEPEVFKNVRLENDALLLTIVPKERGGEATVTFEAKLKQDGVCQGEAKYSLTSGDSGSFDFTGKRVAMSEFDDVTRWSLTFVTPDDQRREATVTVLSKGDKTYGWYSSEDFELPAKSVSVDGDKVVMAMTAKAHGGGDVEVTFRGTVNGDRVEGNAEYSMDGNTGSFPFNGKRKS